MDLGNDDLPKEQTERPRRFQRVKERIVQHDDGEGNWLVSYADLMTLLFGLFVMITAFSTPDTKKMEKLKQETAKSMGGEYTRPYEELAQDMKNILADFKLDKEVTIEQTDEGITLISKGTLFFDSGSTDLKPRARELMEKVAEILTQKARGFRVIVEGHTDDVPIVSRMYPSNWDLSSSRASTVVRLLEWKGFPHADMRPVGLADTEPLVPNRDPAGVSLIDNQAQNRRIVVRVQKQLPQRMAKGK
ncbi:MAG: hypothetical protein A2X94_12430 [Bdellovibrionales bacterium GWB1_55_8]|nr:MAG: hypothetical protein A2X94_12430 [Bdellovibrionales bacterium GWB1_55_8]